MAKPRSSRAAAALAYAKAFQSEAPEIEESQIASFYFASAEIAIADGSRFELSLEAEPAYIPSKGLGWKMTLSGWRALADSCEPIFEVALNHTLSQALAISKTPLLDACQAEPQLLARAMADIAGLSEALGAKIALQEAKELGDASAKSSKPSTRRPSI